MKKFDDIPKNNGNYTFRQVGESFGISQNRSQFLPGRFYYFNIESPLPELDEYSISKLNDGKPYYDLAPCGLVLFHENFKETVLILNLKVIPQQVSQKILEAYYYFSSQNGLSDLFKDDKLISLNERKLIDKRFYLITTTILSQMLGANSLTYAINKYNIDQIREAKLIDWDNFGMLVRPKFSSFGLFPENLNIEKVFENFIQKSLIL